MTCCLFAWWICCRHTQGPQLIRVTYKRVRILRVAVVLAPGTTGRRVDALHARGIYGFFYGVPEKSAAAVTRFVRRYAATIGSPALCRPVGPFVFSVCVICLYLSDPSFFMAALFAFIALVALFALITLFALTAQHTTYPRCRGFQNNL